MNQETLPLVVAATEARNYMRSTINNLYMERFFCPNNSYCALFGLFMILGAALSFSQHEELPWSIWDVMRGSASIIGVCFHMYDLCCSGTFRLLVNSIYMLIVMAGPILSVYLFTKYNITSIPYVCILTILATIFDLIWMTYLVMSAFRTELIVPHSAQRHYCINDSKVEYYQYNAGSGIEEQCIVCLTDYVSGALLIRLACNHSYHRDCILPWLKNNGSCPMCRSQSSVL